MIDDFLPSGNSATRVKPKLSFQLHHRAKTEPLNEDSDDVLDEPITDDAATGTPEDTQPAFTDEPQIAANDDETSESVEEDHQASDDEQPDPQKPKKRPAWPLSRKQTIIAASIVVVLIAAGSVLAITSNHGGKGGTFVSKKPATKPVPKVTTVASTLSGLPVDPSVNNRPVTAVMIENSQDARPQSGLDQAGVVFEAIAEGGVTRFMAVFQDTQPDYLGPVRSARPYYVSWADGFNAGYAHVGGSPDGLADIKAWGVRDLDEFANAGAYHRIASREAPHNMYTSIAALNQLEQSKGYTSSKFTGFARKADQPYKAPAATSSTSKQSAKAATPTDSRQPINSIDVAFSGPIYNAHFDYDAASNSYKRSEGGAPHMTVDSAGNQKQITPKVVIAMVVPLSQGALDASGAYYSNYNPLGSGQAFVFQDGTVTTGTWNKASNEASLSFSDANGKPLTLNAGQTWISAIRGTGDLNYK